MESFEFKINQKAMYEVIADKMEVAILNDTTGIEEKLPSEQFLSETFGVSRPVIREALKILKERGLISMRQGASTYITKPDEKIITKNIKRIINFENIDSMQVYQVRIALETLAAGLAAKNAKKDDILRLKEINMNFSSSEDDVEKNAKYDVDFHCEIANISGNALLSMMISSITVILKPYFEKMASISNKSEKIKFFNDGEQFHEKIIKAIEDGNEKEATDIMRAHLMLSARNYKYCSDEIFE